MVITETRNNSEIVLQCVVFTKFSSTDVVEMTTFWYQNGRHIHTDVSGSNGISGPDNRTILYKTLQEPAAAGEYVCTVYIYLPGLDIGMNSSAVRNVTITS